MLGTGQEAAREVDLHAAADEQVPVVRRHSGGGAVLIGPGVLNFSAFYAFRDLPGSETIRGAMAAVLQPVLRRSWPIGISPSGTEGLSDLALTRDGAVRKIGGNAQARKKTQRRRAWHAAGGPGLAPAGAPAALSVQSAGLQAQLAATAIS